MIDFNDFVFMDDNNRTYTEKEIISLFMSDETLSKEFKSIIMCKLDAYLQAMYNCVKKRDITMQVRNPHGSIWAEQHNEFVSLFQKYNP